METPDEIWENDLFSRRAEAEDLIGYLESVSDRPSLREDGHAHVLAVDTPYGQGKSFFLRRLDRHLRATEHVSAYVDAWVDDLEDEPIVALAATLEKALEPWKEEADVAAGISEFKVRAGRVAKIVGTGLLKRGVGFIITQGAAEALGNELANAEEVSKDIRKDSLKVAGAGLVDDLAGAISDAAQPSMDARIARFREGQAAILAMKSALTQVVGALRSHGMKLPITIIVDELDRCRPTYAIKVLEEIKHLFDVPGVAFVLGMHGDQLAHSVSAAYGSSFDGRAYLRRFFNRRYILNDVEITPLIEFLLKSLNIPSERISSLPQIKMTDDSTAVRIPPAHFIAIIMGAYGLHARDAFSVLEILETCMALTAPKPIVLTYLLPLIIAQIISSPTRFPHIEALPRWKFAHYAHNNQGSSGAWMTTNLAEHVEALDKVANMSRRDLANSINNGQSNLALDEMVDIRYSMQGDNSYADPLNYIRLLRSVSRFKSLDS